MDMVTRKVTSAFDVSGPQEDKRNNDLIKSSSSPGWTQQPVNRTSLFYCLPLNSVCAWFFQITYNITLVNPNDCPIFFPGRGNIDLLL